MKNKVDQLTLKDELILLALDAESGKFKIPNFSLNYGLSGAILLELAEKNKVFFDDDDLLVYSKDSLPEEHKALNELNALIRQKKEPMTIKYWVQKSSGSIKNLRQLVLEDLNDRGIVSLSEKRILGVLKFKRYPIERPKVREAIIQHLREILLENKAIDDKSVKLIGLIKACRMEKTFSQSRSELKTIRSRMKEIAEGLDVGKAVDRTITQIEVAVLAAVIASVASTIAATSAVTSHRSS